MSLQTIGAIIYVLASLSLTESEISGYYFGKDKGGTIDLQLNEDFSFCRNYWSFKYPCHGSGRSSGTWSKKSDTLILFYQEVILDNEVWVIADSFQIKKKKLIQIGPPYRIESQKVKLTWDRHKMSCNESLY